MLGSCWAPTAATRPTCLHVVIKLGGRYDLPWIEVLGVLGALAEVTLSRATRRAQGLTGYPSAAGAPRTALNSSLGSAAAGYGLMCSKKMRTSHSLACFRTKPTRTRW